MNPTVFGLGIATGLGIGIVLFAALLLRSAAQAEADDYQRYAGGEQR